MTAGHEKLDAWIASLTNPDRLRDAGTITRREYIEAMPFEPVPLTKAQRQDRVMASPDRIHGLRYYRRPWLNKDLVRL